MQGTLFIQNIVDRLLAGEDPDKIQQEILEEHEVADLDAARIWRNQLPKGPSYWDRHAVCTMLQALQSRRHPRFRDVVEMVPTIFRVVSSAPETAS